MIQSFFDVLQADTFERTFKGTRIYRNREFCKNHANKYPVIFIEFNSFYLDSSPTESWPHSEFQAVLITNIKRYSKAISNSTKLSEAEKKEFFELGTTKDKRKILFGLRTLMDLLAKHYEKNCIVLIDEYDTPHSTIAQKVDSEVQMEILKDAYKVFLTAALKSAADQSLQFAVLMGVLRISHDQLLSGLNNLTCDMVYKQKVLNSKYFGFDEIEVKKILRKTLKRSKEADTFLEKLLEEVKIYYNGYRRLGEKETFYNPWSITQYSLNHELDSYWKASATDSILQKSYQILPLFEKAELDFLIHNDLGISKRLQDKIHIENIGTDPSIFWSLLVHTGYLTFAPDQKKGSSNKAYSLIVPNKDAREALENVISRFENLLSPDFQRTVEKCIQDGNLKKLFQVLNDWIAVGQDTGYTYAGEPSYHMFLYQTFRICLCNNKEWQVYSERISEDNKARFDVALISRNQAYLFEVKFLSKLSPVQLATKFAEAFHQIDSKKYEEIFQDGTPRSVTKVATVGQAKTLYYETK